MGEHVQLHAEHVIATWTWSSPGRAGARAARFPFLVSRKARARQWSAAEAERSCTRNTSWRRPLPPAPRVHQYHLPVSICNGICATSPAASGVPPPRPMALPDGFISQDRIVPYTICTVAVFIHRCILGEAYIKPNKGLDLFFRETLSTLYCIEVANGTKL